MHIEIKGYEDHNLNIFTEQTFGYARGIVTDDDWYVFQYRQDAAKDENGPVHNLWYYPEHEVMEWVEFEINPQGLMFTVVLDLNHYVERAETRDTLQMSNVPWVMV